MVTGIDVCIKARTLIGYPYVYGGSSPAQGGFDCSGLVQYSYKLCNINLPRTTYDQIKIGTKITDKAKLLPGDLIFYFDEKGVPQHVMLYTGNNSVIEAQYEGTKVKEHQGWRWEGVAVRVLDNAGQQPTQNPTPAPKPQVEVYYRVICGSFKDKVNATTRQTALKAAGFESFIAAYNEKNTVIFRVIVGSYKDKINAEEQQALLTKKGFESFLLAYNK